MSPDPCLLHHVERWRNEGIPPPPEVDSSAFAEALAMSAALSVALAAESDQALATSLRQRLRHHDDSRGHSSSLRMRMAAAPRQRPRRRSQRRAKPLLVLLPLGLAAAVVAAVLLLALPSVDSTKQPTPIAVEQAPAPQRQEPRETSLPEAPLSERTVSHPERVAADPNLRVLQSGTTELRPATTAANVVSGQNRIHVPAGSVVQITEGASGMTAAVSSGEALVEVEGHGPVRIFASERVQISADGVPTMGNGRVILDISAQPGRILAQRSGAHWQARFDPEFALMALDIERFADPLPLRGDEWLQVEYRLLGQPEWMGVYVQVNDAGHHHWEKSWPVAGIGNAWQSMSIALSDLRPNQEGEGIPQRLTQGKLLQLRFQAGLSIDPSQPTVLELRSLRLMSPLP